MLAVRGRSIISIHSQLLLPVLSKDITSIQPYEEQLFWDELIHRLAQGDVVEELGTERYEALSALERAEKLSTAEERYTQLFEREGLKHLTLEGGGLSTKTELDCA